MAVIGEQLVLGACAQNRGDDMEVLCVGHAAFDVVLPVDHFPIENQKIQVANSVESGGGPAANAAYLLAKWGADCGFAGVIGDDHWGRQIIEELELVGVDTRLVDSRAEVVTPLSTILVNQHSGSRTIVNRTGPREPLQFRDERSEEIQPRVLLFDGHEPDASLDLLRRYPEAKSILDAGSLREGTSLLAGKVDYLVASEDYARSASGMESLVTSSSWQVCIDHLGREQSHPVIVTLGGRGLIYGRPGDVQHMSAMDVEPVDTTGAGDVFHGAFAWGILRGFDLNRTLHLASAAAGISVTRTGARPSIPTLAEVNNELSRH